MYFLDVYDINWKWPRGDFTLVSWWMVTYLTVININLRLGSITLHNGLYLAFRICSPGAHRTHRTQEVPETIIEYKIVTFTIRIGSPGADRTHRTQEVPETIIECKIVTFTQLGELSFILTLTGPSLLLINSTLKANFVEYTLYTLIQPSSF